nr:MAG TPA: dUTPase [Caudoviricetes sp.]
MPELELLCKRLTPTAKLPTLGSEQAACYDLYADIEADIILWPNETKAIPTGLAFQPPHGFMLQILSRSGLASKGMFTVGGIVDFDYRGEVKVLLTNNGRTELHIHPVDRIAQMALRRYYHADVVEVDALNDTARGDGGFGHTGR